MLIRHALAETDQAAEGSHGAAQVIFLRPATPGGPGGNRTPDQRLRRSPLCPLSYGPDRLHAGLTDPRADFAGCTKCVPALPYASESSPAHIVYRDGRFIGLALAGERNVQARFG